MDLLSHTAFLIILTTWASCLASSESTSEGDSLLSAMAQWGANFSTWVGNDPCQNWTGVVCNNDNRVISLNLSNTGIAGPVPPEIANLQHLTVLDLSNPAKNPKPSLNRVTGDLSPLQGLVSLVNLNVSLNDIQLATFPSAVFNLVNLISLRIDNLRIQGPLPKELIRLTKLQYMYLGNNSLTGPLPPEYGTLIHLKEMSLWNNNLKSKIPPEYGNLVNLTYLNLHECNLYGGLPSELGHLTKLENVSLYGNSLTGIVPDAWLNMTSLRVLWLHKNYLAKYFPEWLLQLPKLYNVSLDNNLFYGAVSNFPQESLQILSFTCNYFSGATPTRQGNLILNTSGNCFDPINNNNKIRCGQTYFDCDDFFAKVPNGSCPSCPTGQVLEDTDTCVCTLSSITVETGSKKWKIVGSILGVVGFLLLLAFIWWLWSRRSVKPSKRHAGRYYGAQGCISEAWEGPEGVVRFNFEDIARATDDFDIRHEIGAGGFGKVFMAFLDGKQVAIKRAHLTSIQSSSGFRNEVLLLSRLHHKNLVHLLGFCEEEGIQILVYEYMPNGNLHTMLYKSSTTLDWLIRLDIAIGVAHGLEYLHSFADPPVIHRDVKPSNILLDHNMVAKLADFGISKVAPETESFFATRLAGTAGYIDPQYVLSEQLTTASDVYSFGVVLLELISGQKSIDNTRLDGRNLVEWVKSKQSATEGSDEIIDRRLGDRYPKQVYHDLIRLALDCASFRSEDRPSMKAVITILDASRWSVSPLLLHEADTDTSREQPPMDEDVSSADKGIANSLSMSVLMPR